MGYKEYKPGEFTYMMNTMIPLIPEDIGKLMYLLGIVVAKA